jgi:hypothetical protein
MVNVTDERGSSTKNVHHHSSGCLMSIPLGASNSALLQRSTKYSPGIFWRYRTARQSEVPCTVRWEPARMGNTCHITLVISNAYAVTIVHRVASCTFLFYDVLRYKWLVLPTTN